MSIDSIVNVTILIQTGAVSRAGFGIPGILGTNKAFLGLTKEYTSQTDVLADFAATELEAIASNNVFSQSPQVIKLVMMRRATSDTSVVTITVAIDNTNYTITVNGTDFTFNSGGSATVITIAAGLVALITGVGITPTDNLDGTFDLDVDIALNPYTVKVGLNMSVDYSTSDTVPNDIANAQQENDLWFGLTLTSRVEADVLAASGYIETQKKIFGTSSSDLNIINQAVAIDTTSIPAQFRSLSLARSFSFYSANAATQYNEAALFGTILPLDPGSYTAKFKTLSGVFTDNLDSTQETNAFAKNANIYTEVGGKNITCNGQVAEGEFIDIIILADAINARITENVLSLLFKLPKVPFTDKGITAIQAEINEALTFFQGSGGIAIDPPFIITVPLAADISAVDKANRTLNGVTFTATLTGAIHAVTIVGTLQL